MANLSFQDGIEISFSDRLCALNALGAPYDSIVAVAITLRAPQDKNGNARKLFMVYDVLNIVILAVLDMGCHGVGALVEAYKKTKYFACLHHLCEINIPAKEYNQTVRFAKSMAGVYREL